MKKILVLSGAGISAESGIQTFRDSDGLWENYSIEDVCTPQGWKKDRELVLDFYNKRRNQLPDVKPNAAHIALAELGKEHEVQIITQNVDDLHERAGSDFVVHLHGELTKSRSTVDPNLIYEVGQDIKIGDKCEKGSQLRPHVVWFGEDVPEMKTAYHLATQEDLDACIVVGTSMNVYPAAGLSDFVTCPLYVVNPNEVEHEFGLITYIQEPATIGIRMAIEKILNDE